MANLTFSLKHIPFESVAAHTLKNAGIRISPSLSALPWIYLSNFYSHGAPKGAATRALKEALDALRQPVILCCEPVLGSDPRGCTVATAEWSADQRYNSLCSYYRRLGLTGEIPIECTLKTELQGHGRRYQPQERHFLFGVVGASPAVLAASLQQAAGPALQMQ